MKKSLCARVSKVKQITVDRYRTVSFTGEEGRVYSTPYLTRDIEQTCREILLEHAEQGEDSVGIEITVRHVAPTLLGMTVDIAATVTAVDERKVTFDVAEKDEIESIGDGTHTHFVVDVAKTYQRLKARAAKRAAARIE